MKTFLFALVPAIAIPVFFHDTIFWIVEYWFSNPRNLYYFGVMCIAVVLFGNSLYRKELELNFRKVDPWVYLLIAALILVELVNVATLQISGLSAVLLWVTIFVYICGIASRKTRRQVLIPLSLLFFSLPIIYYLNVTFGRVIRVVFVQLIGVLVSLVAPQTEVSGTLITTGSSVVSIDSGCSGIQTLHVLAVLSLILGYIKKLELRKCIMLFVIASATYLCVNFLHLLAVTYLHNVRGISDVHTGHVWLGVVVSVISIGVLFVAWSLVKSPEDEYK